MNVLVLAQLLGWMVLDQRPGQRKKSSSAESEVRLRHA